MKSYLSLFTALIATVSLHAQELRRFEAGAHYSYLHTNDGGVRNGSSGIGGRVVVNANRYLSIEGEVNYFFNEIPTFNQVGGHVTQGLFGAKAGYRGKAIGVFAKARPGFVSFSDVITSANGSLPLFTFNIDRSTHFAFDLGGVVEVYPSNRWTIRFDFGDTMIHFPERTILTSSFPSETRHNFQFSSGLLFRF